MNKKESIEIAILLYMYKNVKGMGNSADTAKIVGDVLSDYINVNHPDQKRVLQSGGTAMDKSVRWSLHDLKEKGYLDNTEKGSYKLTESGIDYLKYTAHNLDWADTDPNEEGILSEKAVKELQDPDVLDGRGAELLAAQIRKLAGL